MEEETEERGCWTVLHMKAADCLDKEETGERDRKRERTEDRRETVEGRVGGGGGVSINDRRVILTVGHTLILDLQILVGPWAGVREYI